MALDVNQGYDQIKQQVSTTKKYKQVKKDVNTLKKKYGSNLDLAEKETQTQLSELLKKSEKFEKSARKIKTQFEELLDISKLINTDKIDTTKGNNKTVKYLKKTFVNALNQLKPKIKDILIETAISAIGCSEDQQYQPNSTIYVNVKSFDFGGFLKIEPDSAVGKIQYEKKQIQYNQFPFSFNKELYQRIQNINQPYSVPSALNYKGVSGQDLFDFTYVNQYVSGSQTFYGDFIKVDLKPRNSNNIAEFIKDYYNTLDPLDFNNFFTRLVDQLSGAISIKTGAGDASLSDLNKVLKILERILGLCFDETKEIDVSGIAKVSELDNINDSFFEFTEIDLRDIELNITDVKSGVVEFEKCDNVKLPVNPNPVINFIDNLNFIDGGNNNNEITDASNITDVITQGFFPVDIDLDEEFLKEFPKALVLSLLSPKIVFPIMTMTKSLNNNSSDQINSYLDFVKNFKTYFVEFTSKISALFVKIIFDIVKKDIKNLVQSLISDIGDEKKKKYGKYVLSLTTILLTVGKIVKDVRECKKVVDDLQNLLSEVQKYTQSLPLPLLLASKLRKGYSKTNAFLNVIEKFEQLGLPTGPMPDGSPNLMLAAVQSIIEGMDDEMVENGRVDVGIGTLSVTPLFLTIPAKSSGVVM